MRSVSTLKRSPSLILHFGVEAAAAKGLKLWFKYAVQLLNERFRRDARHQHSLGAVAPRDVQRAWTQHGERALCAPQEHVYTAVALRE